MGISWNALLNKRTDKSRIVALIITARTCALRLFTASPAAYPSTAFSSGTRKKISQPGCHKLHSIPNSR